MSGSVTLKYEGRVVGGQWSSHTEIWRKGGWWSGVQSHWNMKEGWLVVRGPVTLKYEGRVVGGQQFNHIEIWRKGGCWSAVQSHWNMKEGWLVVSSSITLKYEGRVVVGRRSSHTEIRRNGAERFSHIEIWRKGGWWWAVQSHRNMKDWWSVVQSHWIWRKGRKKSLKERGQSHQGLLLRGSTLLSLEGLSNCFMHTVMLSPVAVAVLGQVLQGAEPVGHPAGVCQPQRLFQCLPGAGVSLAGSQLGTDERRPGAGGWREVSCLFFCLLVVLRVCLCFINIIILHYYPQ